MPANFYQRLIDKYEPMTEAAFLVLVSVRQPITSEAIPAKIAEMTNNQLQLGLGTLFTNLHAMTKDYLMTAHRLQNQISQLRRDTEQYDGAWMPTMHVFVSALTADLDTEEPALKSLGRWTLVGHSKKGQYWYDLQTLANAAEIKQTLRPFVATDTNVNVLSWLGLAPLGWFV
ncbi:hypothetical protein WP50_37420 [Lactiplantibacillus plantarum]|nr:hypothetical protein WP50_37420 [Lactiplantibacillus plantarum]